MRSLVLLCHRSVVDNGTDVVLVALYAITLLTTEAVRLFHLARVAQGIGGPLMVIVKENGELRSYGLAPRRNDLFEEAILHVLSRSLQMRITASPNARVSCSVFPADGIHSLPQPYTRPGPSPLVSNSTLPHASQRTPAAVPCPSREGSTAHYLSTRQRAFSLHDRGVG
jgi:hypothetical protein